MNIQFYGATRQVTGSMHLITTDNDCILLDCGMFQGRRKESERQNRTLPIDPSMITNILLSHAHIDHSGRIPMVTSNDNFNGRIITTRATADACQYLLRDSAHIQESDAAYLNYKTAKRFLHKTKSSTDGPKLSHREIKRVKSTLKKNNHRLNTQEIDALLKKYDLNRINPLYTTAEAEASLELFRGYPYKTPVTVGKGVDCTFYDAGHILGSAMLALKVQNNGKSRNILYSGDIGRFNKPIIEDPTLEFAKEDRDVDLMIMESTYGDRLHEPVADLKPRLKEVIIETVNQGGSIIIPAFAYGRTQELIYFLHELYMADEVPRIPIHVDSPLATNITRVFGEHPETYDEETHETFLENGKNPFSFPQVHFVQSVEESMALNRDQTPHIVLAGSGMCEGGRVLHHLRHKIHDPRNTILIVGFMAQNTLGRRIQDLGEAYQKSGRSGHAPTLKFYNKEYPLKAQIIKLGGFSAHGDKHELLKVLEESNLRVKKIAVVHGEEAQSLAFADYLQEKGYSAFVPRVGEIHHLD